MAEALRRVSPGDPLEIPAEGWNAIVDAVKRVRRLAGGGAEAAWPDTVRVRNTTAGALPVWSVVALAGPAVPPGSDGGSQLQESAVLDGAAPAGGLAERLAVLQSPAEPGEVVDAVADGLTVVRLTSYDPAWCYCWSRPGETAGLASDDAGWEVVWRDGGSTGLAVVRAGPVVSLHTSLVRVTSPTPDPDTGLYDAYLVRWDQSSGTWVDGRQVWVRDLNP